LTFAFLLAWGGFALTGAADAKGPAGGEDQTWAPTEEDLKKHTGEVIVHLNSYPAVDVDGDGDFSRPERTAFVVTVVNQFPQVVLEEFPYADYDEDGELSLIEAFDLVRGNTLIGAEEKRAQLAYTEAVSEGTLDPEQAKEMKAEASRSVLAAYHTHLDMVEWLLAEMPSEPSAYDVAATKAELEPIEAKRAAKMDSKKVAKLQHKIQELRTKAAELEGEEAEELEAKVAQLEDQLKQMKQVKMKGETKSKKKVKMKAKKKVTKKD
jgi:hypothetical protein